MYIQALIAILRWCAVKKSWKKKQIDIQNVELKLHCHSNYRLHKFTRKFVCEPQGGILNESRRQKMERLAEAACILPQVAVDTSAQDEPSEDEPLLQSSQHRRRLLRSLNNVWSHSNPRGKYAIKMSLKETAFFVFILNILQIVPKLSFVWKW